MQRMESNVANPAINRLVLIIVLIFGAVFLAVQGVKSNNFLLMGLVFAIPLGIYFLAHPKSMFVWLYLVHAGSLILPGMRGLTVAQLFMTMVIGWWLASSALTKQKMGRYEKSETFLILFILNLILIVSIRGLGFAMFGGYEMGGGHYIKLILPLLFYFAAARISVEKKHVKWLLFGPLLFGLVPVFADIAVWITHGSLADVVSRFVDVKLSAMSGKATREIGAVRWKGFSAIGPALSTIGLVVRFPKGKGKYLIPVVLIGIATLLSMLSGHRSGMVATGFILTAWCIFMSRNRIATAGLLIAIFVAGWLFLIFTIDFFPANMQRAVSFLPLVEVESEVARSAQNSIDFRLDIWRQCIPHIKEFLLVGRGLVVDVEEWAFLPTSAYGGTDFFFFMHAYHSGPLSLLLDTGLAGFVFGTLFMIFAAREGWKGLSDFDDKKSLAYRFYFLLNIRLTYYIFHFFVIYGAVTKSLSGIIMTCVLMRVLRYSFGSSNAARKSV